jgi:DNA replication protein DnaC
MSPSATLTEQLAYLKLPFIRQHFDTLAQQAAQRQLAPLDFLAQLIEGEVHARQDRALQQRIKTARFPVLKTLETFQWNWPKKMNRMQVQQLFQLAFLQSHSNAIFLGGVGLGKTHLATALAYQACLQGHSVLFTSAIDAINTLIAAQAAGRLKPQLQHYLKPRVLVIDEMGYLPIDKTGADLLFQIISQRYERGSIILTSNRPYKKWAEIFNNDATLTSALLDRLLHHAETVVIEGSSYRMKERTEAE